MSSLNLDFATAFVGGLAAAGLRHVCISPGSRSGPLAIAFARHPGLRTWVHVDERSSGFFALGLAKRAGEPVAVLTTSGTAAAELHPAVLEAHHSRTPLLVLTADRPPEARDRGANQTIDQARLFGNATRWTFDPGPPDPSQPLGLGHYLAVRALAITRAPIPGPVHVNLPFREPLLPPSQSQAASTPAQATRELRVHTALRIPSTDTMSAISGVLGSADRPLLHAGTLPADPAILRALASLSARTNLVIHAEPTSHLRRRGLPGLIQNTEALLRDEGFASNHTPDLVIRLGAAPTSRVLNDWLARAHSELVLLDPDAAWNDPASLATEAIQCDVAPTLQALAEQAAPSTEASNWQSEWQTADERVRASIDSELHKSPLFEAQVMRTMSTLLPANTTVVIGSSMAVRDADWFWQPDEQRRFIANRGASGIDGFVSTALGAAAASAGEPTVAVCGDLTLYHDMNGLLAARKYALPVTFVVLNNDGGGIFSFLRESEHDDVFEDLFATPIGIDLERVAALYDCGYALVAGAQDLSGSLNAVATSQRTTLIDVRFTRADSVSGHRAVWAAAASAMREEHRGAPET